MLLKERTKGLCGLLDDELRRFSPGSRFYSVRQLMLRYRVSRRVVDAALAELERGGAIETRPQSGIFVKRNRIRKHVALLLPDWPSEGNKRFQTYLKAEYEKRADGCNFSTIPYDYQEDLVRKIAGSPADVHIVLCPGVPIRRDELAGYAALQSEVIFMWSDLAAVSMHSLRSDSEYGGMLAASCFIRKGHRQLAVLPSEPRNRDVVGRIAGYTGAARLFGAEVREIPCEVHSGDYSMSRAHDAVCDYLQTNPCDFTALFLMSDESSQGAMAALAEHGIRIPDDVSIIGYGNDRSSGYFTPHLTTISGRQRECAAKLAAAIDRLFEGSGELIDISVPPTLVERNSVKDLKKHPTTGDGK
ncbi:MAG: substrate-binding domain-containing protein [Lentisphaeria bacterium]|nr:substrate-binding domain-containing protein [Lentisphaeria bacterium]